MGDPVNWEPLAESIQNTVREFFSNVGQIWDEMGLEYDSKISRFEQGAKHVQDLIGDMHSEAVYYRDELAREVKKLVDEATSLSKDLQGKVWIPGDENLPLLVIKTRILNELQHLRTLKQQRISLAKELIKRESDICKALGSKPIGISAELPSESELQNFRLYLDKIEAEKIRMETTFKDLQSSIIQMMDELHVSPFTDFENLIYNKSENFILNNANMTKLKELADRMKKQVQEAKEDADKKKEQLQDLWKYLEEPDDKCERFLERHQGYSRVTLNAFDKEIKRCKDKRSENISKYVAKVRSQIVALWDQCQIGDEERQSLQTIMQSGTFSEDLLVLHEMEVEKLQKYYEDNRVIFELLEVRDNLWQKMENLEQRATDPNRFHNRGGQLLAEEKERKVIQKKLPKIEEEIRALVYEYELKHGKPFTTNGVPLAEALKQSWTDYIEAKQSLIIARKQARDQSSTSKKTPLSISKRTPSAMSMRRPSPATSAQRKQQGDLTPANRSRKRPNQSSGSGQVVLRASKIKRRNYGHASRRIFVESTQNGNENHISQQIPANSSTSISSYGEFQEHLENRDELRSSVLPRQVLKSSNLKITTSSRIKTPMKPLRKNFTAAINTPRRGSPSKLQSSRLTPRTPRTPNTPRSPKTTSTSRLAPAPGTLPFIF